MKEEKNSNGIPVIFPHDAKIAFIRTALLFFLSPFFNFHCKTKGTEGLTCEEEKSQTSNKRSMKYINNKRLSLLLWYQQSHRPSFQNKFHDQRNQYRERERERKRMRQETGRGNEVLGTNNE